MTNGRSDREIARERADSVRNMSDIVVYSDASGREDHLGTAIVALNDQEEVVESQQVQVGPMERWSVHVAELIGIFYAVDMVFKLAHRRTNVGDGVRSTATISCDSRSALQTIQNPSNKSGQRIVHAIIQAASEVQAENIRLRLRWIPEHCGNVGNDAADRLAKEAAQPGKTHPFQRAGDSRARADRMPEAPNAAGGIEKESRGRDEQRVEPAGRLKRR